jgi:hypothetical protein
VKTNGKFYRRTNAFQKARENRVARRGRFVCSSPRATVLDFSFYSQKKTSGGRVPTTAAEARKFCAANGGG